MKKIGIVFFFIAIAATAGFLVFSCNSAVSKDFGTVVFDFEGGGRAIGADGLPVLSGASIRIEGKGALSGSFNKEFSSAEGVSLSFPVGDKVELKVSVLTPSARWSSPLLVFTVEPGTNAVGVKLSKQTAALHTVLFSRKSGAGSTSPAAFSLKLEDGTDILSNLQINAATTPSFVRDSKGGMYVVYAEYVSSSEPKKWQMFFYDSEGKNPKPIALPVVPNVSSYVPVNDFTTGTTYMAAVSVSGGELFRLHNGDMWSAPAYLNCKDGYAVDNNRLVRIDKASATDVKLQVYSNVDDLFAGSFPNPVFKNIADDIEIEDIEQPDITDIYMRGDYVYILFSASESAVNDLVQGGFYSAGGLLRYKIIQTAAGLQIGDAEKFGFNEDPDVDTFSVPNLGGSEITMLKDYDYNKGFYAPVRFIGFDEEYLYIADDGLISSYREGIKPGLTQRNENRIAAFNIQTGSLDFENAPQGTAWLVNADESVNCLPSHVKVDYDDLEDYLNSTASEDEVNNIEITGTIPVSDFTGSSNTGELGRRIRMAPNKKIALKLPEELLSVADMSNCFYSCSNLVSVVNIPANVRNMQGCFSNCIALTRSPALPARVENMLGCFSGCTSLTAAPVIPADVTNMQECFNSCTSLTEAPVIPEKVMYLAYCFTDCTALVFGPDIPARAQHMVDCFKGCTKLKRVKLKCTYNPDNILGNAAFLDAFEDCDALESGGIQVPNGQLSVYRDNAGTMGTESDKFSGF